MLPKRTAPVAAYSNAKRRHTNTDTSSKELGEPFGKPPVHAEKRQQLCNTVPYFRQIQAGHQPSDDKYTMRALLVDGSGTNREIINEEIIITNLGGCKEKDPVTGQTIQYCDQQESNKQYQQWMATWLSQTPVIVIAGKGKQGCPSKLPHAYNVLGHFHVTDLWWEKNTTSKGTFDHFMMRLEKIELHNKSWWAPMQPSEPLSVQLTSESAAHTNSHTCRECSHLSKEIFNLGWTCLNRTCSNHFVFYFIQNEVMELVDFNQNHLKYNQAFMNERTIYTTKHVLEPLVPAYPTSKTCPTGYEDPCKDGIVCDKCGSCIRRVSWENWTCESDGCGWTYKLDQMEISPLMAKHGEKSTMLRHFMRAPITSETVQFGMFLATVYALSDAKGNVVGHIAVFEPNDVANALPDGPDQLFTEMQNNSFSLKRRAVRQAEGKGEMLTAHWSTNFGVAYKYSVPQDGNVGFQASPDLILKVVKRLTWAGQQVADYCSGNMGTTYDTFNELLAVGYYGGHRKTKMGWHHDGQHELGSTVAFISLGASSSMLWRAKGNSGIGCKSRNRSGTKLPILQFTLKHGSVCVMHGKGIQEFYEHSAEPNGLLRYALTCRYVDPMKKQADYQEQAKVDGAMPARFDNYEFNGETGLGHFKLIS